MPEQTDNKQTPFQILQTGNDEPISIKVIETLEPEEIDRLMSYLEDPREYVTAH